MNQVGPPTAAPYRRGCAFWWQRSPCTACRTTEGAIVGTTVGLAGTVAGGYLLASLVAVDGTRHTEIETVAVVAPSNHPPLAWSMTQAAQLSARGRLRARASLGAAHPGARSRPVRDGLRARRGDRALPALTA